MVHYSKIPSTLDFQVLKWNFEIFFCLKLFQQFECPARVVSTSARCEIGSRSIRDPFGIGSRSDSPRSTDIGPPMKKKQVSPKLRLVFVISIRSCYPMRANKSQCNSMNANSIFFVILPYILAKPKHIFLPRLPIETVFYFLIQNV